MLRSLYVVLFEQSFDSSTDWGETASVERPLAAGHLKRYRGQGNEMRQGKQQTLGLVYFI